MKPEPSLFGDTPALVSKEFDQRLNLFWPAFDHIVCGSHLPPSPKLTNQPNSAKTNEWSSPLPQMPTPLYSTRITTLDLNVPDILRAVGLAKLVRPKCYINKKKIVHLPKTEVTLTGITFVSNGHFGKLDWEQ